MYEIVPTTEEHVAELSHSMRPEDVAECWAAQHLTPYEAIKRSLSYTDHPKTGLVDGKVINIWGVGKTTSLSDEGIPWMLTSHLVDYHIRPFLVESKAALVEMKKEASTFSNVVDARNNKAIKWLKWLGFKMEEAAPYGPDHLPFHQFTMEN